MGKEKQFYIGKIFNQKTNQITDENFYYDPPDLTTHMVVTGMTGSGKTGLCVGLIEEAALQKIPAILIDPKGDMTNLMLTFPDQKPEDFSPWLDPDTVRREKKTLEELAEKTAASWKTGLADWGLGAKDIKTLSSSVQRAIYTPGLSAGLPISILASFQAPDMNWQENEELLREKISATVTALLTLIGLKDIDPLRSREHILLANIMEHSWKQGAHLDLTSLILQTQNPPFDRLGAFSLNEFFSKKDRASLAMRLNNFLASPTFQTWIEGQPLDIEQILYTSDGQPRHSIFYLAHLSDAERMFFVTLLYSTIETWMRRQTGTGSLRAMVYFDEIHGYLPPISNPPSKPLIVRLFKTARAFGLGLILTTQNPVDVDYKALSNAGTWMIGRLQTDQDKQRLLDGLESAAGGVERKEYGRLISSLGKRVFLCHNVHAKKPSIFHTRWVMSYLAGPMTITQIPAINQLAGITEYQPPVKDGSALSASKPAAPTADKFSQERMSPSGVSELFFPVKKVQKDTSYYPSLIAIAEIRYFSRSPQVNFNRTISALIPEPRETGQNWEDFTMQEFDANQLIEAPQSGINFAALPEFMTKPSWWSAQEKEFEHWIYETDVVAVRTNKSLAITAGPEVDEDEFSKQCQEAADEKIKDETAKLESKFLSRQKSIESKIKTQQTKVEKLKKEATSRGLDTALRVGTTLLNLATKKKLTGLSSSATKARMTSDAKGRLTEAENLLENYQNELTALDSELEQEKQNIIDKWAAELDNTSAVKLTPTKQNIRIAQFGIAWDAGQ